MKKLIYLLIAPAILLLSATFTACSDDDESQPPIPATLKEAQEKVLGKWVCDDLELTFMPDQTIRIKHNAIDTDEFTLFNRDEVLPYMMQKNDKLIQLRIGEYDATEDYEYMFIYRLTDNTMKVEMYMENLFFTLSKESGN